jgi:hypothetical protein
MVLGWRIFFPGLVLTLVLNWFKESGNSLYGERAKEKPFLARFASPDRYISSFWVLHLLLILPALYFFLCLLFQMC